MEIEINEKVRARLVNLLNQRNAIENQMQSEVNLILDVKEVNCEGAQISLNDDITKILVSFPEKLEEESSVKTNKKRISKVIKLEQKEGATTEK